MSLLRHGKARVLTIYLGESDQWQGLSLSSAILQLLRDEGCAGATVTRAIAGYGAGARLHDSQTWQWSSSDAPLIIQVVDQPARLQRLIPQLQEMMQGGLMTLHETNVLKYTHARRQGIPTRLPVRKIMETAVVSVGPDTHVSTIVEMLLQVPFRALPVVDAHDRLCGIISTGDLINAGLLPMRRGVVRKARELDQQLAVTLAASLQAAQQSGQTAQDIMNPQVHTIGPDQPIKEAARILIDTGVRNLPVVDAAGILRGMITRADLLQAIRTSPLLSPEASSATRSLSRTNRPLEELPPQQQPVTTYLNTDVATVREETPFAEIIDILMTSPIKRVIVVDPEQHVKGIISDVDVLARLQEEGRSHLLETLAQWARGKPLHLSWGTPHAAGKKAQVAADVMNRAVETIAETASVQDATGLMMDTHHKILPVVDQQQRLLGTVGRSDLLQVLLESEAS
jgi:CBS-domain-containing membrane protein